MKNSKKNTAAVGVLITAECVLVVYVYIFLQVSHVGWSVIPYLLDQGVGFEGQWAKKFGCKSVDDNVDGLNVQSVIHMGSGGTPGVIIDDSEILWLDSLES